MTNRKDVIIPDSYVMKICIALDMYGVFKKVFWNEKVYKFHVEQKIVKGSEIIFGIRAMRVNEFVDILDENKIPWRRPEK